MNKHTFSFINISKRQKRKLKIYIVGQIIIFSKIKFFLNINLSLSSFSSFRSFKSLSSLLSVNSSINNNPSI